MRLLSHYCIPCTWSELYTWSSRKLFAVKGCQEIDWRSSGHVALRSDKAIPSSRGYLITFGSVC
jgi:hypothetical protein